ncbi:short-chain fatty acyl-CoA regulator family protein [Acetobacter sp. AN02]|uniref:helix-turn-helix domain-containing protein n=1 Tax=Acetobacter sp. AN02 TaxID=2894186 RepID=UPI002434147D|nr:helix-turn-helix transcriptional regulator [Acetobacter sp. AN02]MDG6093857.1 short-chain fatty acyl-CoA regulator family protein [Acetobacter sp. AN02]
MPKAASKIFAGARIRDLRLKKAMTQADLARGLGISGSYLNQIENEQRPLPGPLMLKLCNLFGVPAGYFGDSDELHRIQALREIMGDPLFRNAGMNPADIQASATRAPVLTDRFITLYRAWRAGVEREIPEDAGMAEASEPGRISGGAGLEAPEGAGPAPYDAVGDWVQAARNYFHDIDRAAEEFYETERLGEGLLSERLMKYLSDRHGIRVVTDHDLDRDGLAWRFDRRGRRLIMADGVPSESMIFRVAQVIGQLDFSRVLDRPVRSSGLPSGDARSIARVGMTNYFAGALLLPYERFRQAARELRHDLDQLQRRFGVSFEQVCHRLSTLQRPGAEGLPFYFIKTDIAGNILKSYSATRFSHARFGGLCPRWNVFRCFASPLQLQVQLSRATDGSLYLNVARTVGHAATSYFDRPRQVAVVLGCSAAHAQDIVYSAGLDADDERMVVPIGPGCRACTRTDCRHRAVPPAGMAIDTGSEERGVAPYRTLERRPGQEIL